MRFIKHRSRDAHLIVAGMPVFSAAWWKGRDFDAATLEAPLGSGAYKVKTFEQGRFIEFERNADYWGKDLPVNLGHNNFQRLRFEYYRERQVAFEAFKAGAINYHRGIYFAHLGDRLRFSRGCGWAHRQGNAA